MGDEDSTAGMLGKFGGMLGKGAAKAGKRAAQSETGRKATTYAVKGACDGVKEDLINKYGSPPATPTSPGTFSAPPSAAQTPTSAPPPLQTQSERDGGGGDDETTPTSLYSMYSGSSSTAPKPATRRTAPPPKPSLFNRLNFLKKDSGGKAPPPRVLKDPRDRVYKQRLAKTPDWDRLPLAQTLYNFKGEMRCDLEFRKGQVIQVMTRTETQEDWWEGRLEGRVGIFPANYVKLL